MTSWDVTPNSQFTRIYTSHPSYIAASSGNCLSMPRICSLLTYAVSRLQHEKKYRHRCFQIWGFHKMVVPQQPWVFPTKNDHFGVEIGGTTISGNLFCWRFPAYRAKQSQHVTLCCPVEPHPMPQNCKRLWIERRHLGMFFWQFFWEKRWKKASCYGILRVLTTFWSICIYYIYIGGHRFLEKPSKNKKLYPQQSAQ